MITFENVNKSFGSVQVLKNINLKIRKGETFCLLGNSGSGKTTLLKLINKLIVSDSGSIHINDQNMNTTDVKRLRMNTGYVIQSGGLFPHMKVRANIALPLKLNKKSGAEINERVSELINQIGLDESFLDRYPASLSGGQRQRVGIARAIANKPDLLLLDEPFSALDPVLRDQMQNDFLKMSFLNSVTKVLVTHDLREAVKLGDNICLMEQGQIVFTGKPADFLSSTNATVSNYIGDESISLLIANLTLHDLTVAHEPFTDAVKDPYPIDRFTKIPEMLYSRHPYFFHEEQNIYYSRQSVKEAFIDVLIKKL